MFARRESKQFEFFDEFKKSKEKRFKRFKLPSIGDEKIIIRASYEGLVFVAIGFVLVLTLVFSLGVERGKNLGQPQTKIDNKTTSQEAIVEREVVEEQTVVKQTSYQEKEQVGFKDEFYTIQVVAYRNVSQALKEKEKINKMGLESFILNKNKKGYFLVCAGSFEDKSAAQKKSMSLRKIYNDCFVKKVKKEEIYND